ncbi:MAG: type II secretion system secretin GspD [Gammaproteobacteria bacterium]|nr:type II secretion system secretin GspD [Gammaproteobacteria bacterium]
MTKKSVSTLSRTLRLLAASSLLSLAALAWAQQPAATVNWKDADIRQVVEAVSAVTGKNVILDPRVTGKVTLLSPTPLGPDAMYEAFLSILQVHGYVAIESDNLVKVVPDATARQLPTSIGPGGAYGPDDLTTQVVQLRNVGATQLVSLLRPLLPQYGHLVAHAGSNMLVISDRAANVARVVSIIRRIDQASDEDIEVVSLQHASAGEIVRIMTALTSAPRGDGASISTSLVADARTNSVLIGGDMNERLRLRTLIAHLDTPLEDGGETQVRYLRYADAEEMATKLQQNFTNQAQSPAGQAAASAGADEMSVWADTQTNALVINAPPKIMRSTMQIIDKLDIRRAQVLVEAIIVEVIIDKSKELGVSVAVEGSGSNSPIAVTNFPDFLAGIVQLGSASGGGVTDPSGLIGDGGTIGVGRITDDGVSFAAILSAVEGAADTNLISTPSIVTTDNEEATLNVGQDVPFVSGSFSNTGGSGAINPFQTINRETVGVKLAITPQINEGDSMVLDVSQEISSIAQSAQGAVDLIVNKRTIDTTVIVDDGEILVLGGLLEDVLRESDQRVPILGDIPLLGVLFRSRRTEKLKTNLMIFIRPTILRDATQTSFETNQKYNYIRDVQQGREGTDVQMMPGQARPMLPPIEQYTKPKTPEEDQQ